MYTKFISWQLDLKESNIYFDQNKKKRNQCSTKVLDKPLLDIRILLKTK